MNKLKVETIIKKIKDRGLTAYEISKHIPLSEDGINKILSGHSKNPRQSTLQLLHDYLNGNLRVVKEKTPPEEVRFEDMVAEKVYQRMQPELKELKKEQRELTELVLGMIPVLEELLSNVLKIKDKA